MHKLFTADEMREIAEQIDDECADAIADERTIASAFDVDTAQTLRDMLRQAADMMEREEREEREKRYEYASVLPDGSMSCAHDDNFEAGYHAFRREVGEWEPVPCRVVR